MLSPPLLCSQGTQHCFPHFPSRFATLRVQEKGFFSLCELLMPSLIWFTHRHVFQVRIITVFMLITSTALSARIHTHIHQLSSLLKKKKKEKSKESQLSHSGTLQHLYQWGRYTHAGCMVPPSAEANPGFLGMPQTAGPDTVSCALQQHWLAMPSGDMQGQQQPALATMQKPPHRPPHHSPEVRRAGGSGTPRRNTGS